MIDLSDYQRRGVVFALDRDGLAVDAPTGTLTDAEWAALKSRRAEIIAILLRQQLEDLNAKMGLMPSVRGLREIPAAFIDAVIGWRVREVVYRAESGDRACLLIPMRCSPRARLACDKCDRGHTFHD